jgi:death-on-curing family protein
VESLGIREVEEIAFDLARRHLEFDEPIPDFSSRFPGVLESCLAVPFQRFYHQDAYPTLVDRASILFYLLIKDHPFQNGNKRIAITTLFVFLGKNGKWLKVDMDELYTFTVQVAQSKPEHKSFVLGALNWLISHHIVDDVDMG